MVKPDNCPYTCADVANCSEICTRYGKMNHMLEHCNVPNYMDFIKCSADTEEIEPKVLELLKDWKSNVLDYVGNGKNLYISSPYIQTGKTLLSVKIMFKYFDEVWATTDFITRGYFIPVQELLGKAKNFKFFDTEEFQQLDTVMKQTDVVIWDGITDWPLSSEEQKLLTRYIKYRFDRKRSNIFNGLSQEELKDTVGGILAEYIGAAEQADLYDERREVC